MATDTTEPIGCIVQPIIHDAPCFTCGDEGTHCPDCTPSDVPPWSDFDPIWPDAAPTEPRLTLAELVACEASFYRSWRTDAGDLVAETLETLVRGIRSTSATSPDQYRERIELLDNMDEYDRRHEAEEQGYRRGRAECG